MIGAILILASAYIQYFFIIGPYASHEITGTQFWVRQLTLGIVYGVAIGFINKGIRK